MNLLCRIIHCSYVGKWILKKDFLEDSIKAGKWLSEEMYEWNEQSTVTGLSVSHMTAPGRWRRILQQKRGPFEGWKVLVAVADAKKRAAYKRSEIKEQYLLEITLVCLHSQTPLKQC